MLCCSAVVFTDYGFNAVYISVHLSFSLPFSVSGFLRINVFITPPFGVMMSMIPHISYFTVDRLTRTRYECSSMTAEVYSKTFSLLILMY